MKTLRTKPYARIKDVVGFHVNEAMTHSDRNVETRYIIPIPVEVPKFNLTKPLPTEVDAVRETMKSVGIVQPEILTDDAIAHMIASSNAVNDIWKERKEVPRRMTNLTISKLVEHCTQPTPASSEPNVFVCKVKRSEYDGEKQRKIAEYICMVSFGMPGGPAYTFINTKSMEVFKRFLDSELNRGYTDIFSDPQCPHCSSPIKRVRWLDYRVSSDEPTQIITVEDVVEYNNRVRGFDTSNIYRHLHENQPGFRSHVASEPSTFYDQLMEKVTEIRSKNDGVEYTTSPTPGPYCMSCGLSIRDWWIKTHFHKEG